MKCTDCGKEIPDEDENSMQLCSECLEELDEDLF